MGNATITGMDLIYQTLIPFKNFSDYHLSVGSITILLPEELPLDFNCTLGKCNSQVDGTSILDVEIRNFEAETFLKQYHTLGFLPMHFTYDFFSSRHTTATVAEIDTELFHLHSETCIPLTLKSICLLFSDGRSLDYTDRIGIHALWQLSEVA